MSSCIDRGCIRLSAFSGVGTALAGQLQTITRTCSLYQALLHLSTDQLGCISAESFLSLVCCPPLHSDAQHVYRVSQSGMEEHAARSEDSHGVQLEGVRAFNPLVYLNPLGPPTVYCINSSRPVLFLTFQQAKGPYSGFRGSNSPTSSFH